MSNNNLTVYLGIGLLSVVGGILGYKYDIFSDSSENEQEEKKVGGKNKEKEIDDETNKINEEDNSNEIDLEFEEKIKKPRKKTLKRRPPSKRRSSSFSY